MVHIINALRANLLRKEVEKKVRDAISPKLGHWGQMRQAAGPHMCRAGRLLQRLDRLRQRQWAPWKDKR